MRGAQPRASAYGALNVPQPESSGPAHVALSENPGSATAGKIPPWSHPESPNQSASGFFPALLPLTCAAITGGHRCGRCPMRQGGSARAACMWIQSLPGSLRPASENPPPWPGECAGPGSDGEIPMPGAGSPGGCALSAPGLPCADAKNFCHGKMQIVNVVECIDKYKMASIISNEHLKKKCIQNIAMA